jgi:hypothetical protein
MNRREREERREEKRGHKKGKTKDEPLITYHDHATVIGNVGLRRLERCTGNE